MLKIRRMKSADVNQVYALGKKTPWLSVSSESLFWSKKELREWVKSPDDTLLVAEDNGHIVGFTLSQLHKPTGKATLEDIVVKKGYRKKGIGSKLLKRCLKQLRKNGATYICALTKTNNKITIKFSLKHGFQKGYDFTWLEKNYPKKAY